MFTKINNKMKMMIKIITVSLLVIGIYGCAFMFYNLALPEENDGAVMFEIEVQPSYRPHIEPSILFVSDKGKEIDITDEYGTSDSKLYIRKIPVGKYNIEFITTQLDRSWLPYVTREDFAKAIPNLPKNFEVKKGEATILGKFIFKFPEVEVGMINPINILFESGENITRELCERFFNDYDKYYKDANKYWKQWYDYWYPKLKKQCSKYSNSVN